jgi:Reverse transcriptase (RNA-dependent DNA polymerase)
MKSRNSSTWLKNRGYLHITRQIDVYDNSEKVLSKIYNKHYVAKYAFFPLIHASIDERRYKNNPPVIQERCHSYKDENGVTQKHIKKRPLHYATHMDALIFGYYAEILQGEYEKELTKNQALSDCILAYRKIKIPNDKDGKCKSTLHFANEVFSEIQNRGQNDDCVVLTFDIKSFFPSLNHNKLKEAWAKLIKEDKLPNDHFNVFKAATRFSYILLDDLRVSPKSDNRKAGFDEKKLAQIRNRQGFNAFFESTQEFRQKIKNGDIKLHRFPFRKGKDNQPTGIPQGLPISAILANLYLLEFDKIVYQKIVKEYGGYYRRYSDDMVIICKKDNSETLKAFIESAIEDSLVEISRDKTEMFWFRNMALGKQTPRLTSIKLTKNRCIIEAPFTYLGFEFYGSKTLIKSANLAKFYRRMISTVKRKSKLALKIAEKEEKNPVIFKKRLHKIYVNANLSRTKTFLRHKKFIQNNLGDYRIVSTKKDKNFRSNYLSYIKRASCIMKETAILRQIKKHKNLFNQAFNRHLSKI